MGLLPEKVEDLKGGLKGMIFLGWVRFLKG